ncbi:DUF4158 domain-containing protein [Streptomyces sp. JL4002]|uniref:DUF4158 domain-containing protein n=1 Tax=Streptomyces sp. JL4002 TaxID=3404781 RepID=UPI003B28D415
MTSIERTAYPRFKRLITARELHVFFTPSEEERAWAEETADSDEHQLALLLALKSYQRMGCFPRRCLQRGASQRNRDAMVMAAW